MSLPKYLNDKSNKEISIKQEKRVQRQLNSGALAFNKGDLIDGTYMYELKIGKKQVTVTNIMLNKLYEESWKVGKVPILMIEIGNKIFVGEVKQK